ncbi:WD40 repeat-like protein [Ceratobasidium sp. AG-I]|nr:WD40 repeat-like protein [Ceratobasidium sp. AG-I]
MFVVEVCAMAWEHLEKLQQLHDDLRKLLGGLDRMVPFIDFVKEHAKNSLLGNTINALLNLIEDASNFMIEYLSDSAPIRLLRSPFDGSAPDRVGGLLQQFADLKEDFDRSVRVQVLESVLTNAQHALIDKLNPAARSYYGNTTPCQSGTRKEVLADTNQWLDDQGAAERLLWLYGHAGQGKSSIASSICTALDNRGTLGAHFFCKQDDPDLRSPERILNTIVHRLAMKYKAYGHAVSTAIDGNTELPNSSLQSRYSNLIEKPLQLLALKKQEQSGLLVVVIDALDECEKGDGRRSLLAYLRGLSTLVPWIRVIVTSRPDQDIKLAFGKPNDSVICARNVHDYNSSNDIYAYTRKQMSEIAMKRNRADWPDDIIQLLSQHADGLFIWAATACRFISDAVNVDQRLKQLVEGTGSSGSSYRLDVLYTAAIRQSMESEDPDNVEYTRQCVAVIVATASRTPLPVSALEALLCDKFGAGVLRYVVDGLGSVLYEDRKNGDAVRVYHPSFADYITNPARSKEFHVTAESINTTLAECCMSIMMRELRFNICGLGTSHLLNRDIPNLSSRARSAIAAHLEYSCVHWSSHLSLTSKDALNSQLGKFLMGPVLLFWIEALSLLARLNVALSSLREVRVRTSGTQENYAACAHDAYRFVLSSYDAISESTPHLYISALPLAPRKSMMAERMWPLFPNMFRVVEGADEHWPACMRTVSLGERLSSAAISPDGRLIATSCSDALQLWDAETGEAMSSPLKSPRGSLEFSHDGRLLFCCLNSGGIQAWDVEILKPVLMTLPAMPANNGAIALSCNGRLAFEGLDDSVVTIWDLASSTTVLDLVDHSGGIRSLAFSPNCRLIASASYEDSIRISDTDTGATLFSQAVDARCVAFSPDSCYVVCGCWSAVRIWDISTHTQIAELHISGIGPPQPVAYSPNGKSVLIGSDESVRIWDLNEPSTCSTPLLVHTDIVNCAMFSPDGHHVISGSFDGTLKIWDVETHYTAVPIQTSHSSKVNQVVFSLDNRHVLSASQDKTVGTWDARTARGVCDLAVSPTDSPCHCISPDCQRVVTEQAEAWHIWDTGSGTSTVLSGAAGLHRVFAFSSDSLRLVSASSGSLQQYFASSNHSILQVHDVETGAELLPPIDIGQHLVHSVAYSSCGRFVASGDCSRTGSGTICVWSAVNGEAVGKPLECSSPIFGALVFSPDGRLIAASSDNSIRIYEVDTGTLVHDLPVTYRSITALDFSPNGRRMVSGTINNTIHIWNMELDAPTCELLLGHTSNVSSVTFSHDGSLIASGSSDHTVRIWDAANTSTAIEASLGQLASALYPIAYSSSDPAGSLPQVFTKQSEPPVLRFPTSHLAHRLTEGGWVSLVEGSVLLWLLPDHRLVDDSIAQVSARHLPRHHIDFSKFVHGNQWVSVASDSVCLYNSAA